MSPKTRAAMAAEARRAMVSGPDDVAVPNFLAMDGTWKVMCPCGQIHDPSTCEVAQGAPKKDVEADDMDDMDDMDTGQPSKSSESVDNVASVAATDDVHMKDASDMNTPPAVPQ